MRISTTHLRDRLLVCIERQEASGSLPRGAGIGVSVVADGQLLLKETLGLRERDRNLPVSPATIFQIGSLTKAFTSTALVMASERGTVSLDAPINAGKQLLPVGDEDISRHLSIADVLSHRTGIAANDLLWYLGALRPDELMRVLPQLDVVPGAFRQGFVYNNLMYGALGHLFRELVGDTWESYVEGTLLTPLDMRSTRCHSRVDGSDVALPYAWTERIPRIDLTGVAAAGAICSTLDDMTKWVTFHVRGGETSNGDRLLSESSLAQMHNTQIAVENANPLLFQGLEWIGKNTNYGLGWLIGSTKWGRVVYHPGYIDGFSAVIVLVPEKKLGFVVLMNVNLSGVPGLLVENLLDALSSADGAPGGLSDGTSCPAPGPSITGRYASALFGTVSIDLVGSQLVLRYKHNEWPLTSAVDGTADFTVSAFGMKIPLSAQFEADAEATSRLLIPFSLDPRVPPQVFIQQRNALT